MTSFDTTQPHQFKERRYRIRQCKYRRFGRTCSNPVFKIWDHIRCLILLHANVTLWITNFVSFPVLLKAMYYRKGSWSFFPYDKVGGIMPLGTLRRRWPHSLPGCLLSALERSVWWPFSALRKQTKCLHLADDKNSVYKHKTPASKHSLLRNMFVFIRSVLLASKCKFKLNRLHYVV